MGYSWNQLLIDPTWTQSLPLQLGEIWKQWLKDPIDIGLVLVLTYMVLIIIGGMGSIPGSILGAFILGYASTFTDYVISPSLSSIIPIVVILVMLLVRPQGLLGKKELF